jgi:BirA family biotin operon repressor/biotin-[acetyl-CoA-carboxylase] ligase
MEVEMVREALNESAMNATLRGSYWRVSVFQSVTSTQTELIGKENLQHGDVYVTEYQSAGRGRLDRTFEATKSSALLFSLYLEPKRSKLEWSAIPLLVGLSLVNALKSLDAKVTTNLKWPNDLLIGDKKLAGILVEARDSNFISAREFRRIKSQRYIARDFKELRTHHGALGEWFEYCDRAIPPS